MVAKDSLSYDFFEPSRVKYSCEVAAKRPLRITKMMARSKKVGEK